MALRKRLSEMLLLKQLKVLGHWLRRPTETTIKKYALYTTNQGRNRTGGPRATYVKSVQKVTGMDNHVLFQLVENWEEWQRFVARKIEMKPWLGKVRCVIYLKRQQIFVQLLNINLL